MVSEPSPPIVIRASIPALVETADELVGAVDLDPGAVGLLHRVRGRVAAVGRAEDRAAEVRRCRARLAARARSVRRRRSRSGNSRPLKPSRMPTTSQPAVACRQRHGADDRVQPRRVAAAGADRHTSNLFHPTRQYVTFRAARAASSSVHLANRFVRGRGRNEPSRVSDRSGVGATTNRASWFVRVGAGTNRIGYNRASPWNVSDVPVDPILDALPSPSARRLAVRVTPDALRHVRAGHPWIFADSITSINEGAGPATWPSCSISGERSPPSACSTPRRRSASRCCTRCARDDRRVVVANVDRPGARPSPAPFVGRGRRLRTRLPR